MKKSKDSEFQLIRFLNNQKHNPTTTKREIDIKKRVIKLDNLTHYWCLNSREIHQYLKVWMLRN